MKNYHYKKDWCSISILGVKVCLQTEFDTDHIDTFMAGCKLREGVAITLFGITIGLRWSYGK